MKRTFTSGDGMERRELEWADRTLVERYFVDDEEYSDDETDYDTAAACLAAVDARVAELVSFGYTERSAAEQPPRTIVDDVASAAGVSPSRRYVDFMTRAEADRYRGLAAKGFPGWMAEVEFVVGFTANPLELAEVRDVDLAGLGGFVPLARLRGETDFLAVKIDHPECPVGFWNHEFGGIEPYQPSLDAFLASLARPTDPDA